MTKFKKLNWENDFLYLFIMTFSNRGIKKYKSYKEKMRNELKDKDH